MSPVNIIWLKNQGSVTQLLYFKQILVVTSIRLIFCDFISPN